MPTYQYACTACAERLEVVQRFSDDALTECPACAGTLRKVFSPVGVVFKGSGFYKTDSRSSSATATSSTSASADGSSSAESAAPADPKPTAPAQPAAPSTATPKAAAG